MSVKLHKEEPKQELQFYIGVRAPTTMYSDQMPAKQAYSAYLEMVEEHGSKNVFCVAIDPLGGRPYKIIPAFLESQARC